MTTTATSAYAPQDRVLRPTQGMGTVIRMDGLAHVFVQWPGLSMARREHIENVTRYVPPPAPVRRRRRAS